MNGLLYIDGRWTGGAGEIPVRNPAHPVEVVGTVAEGSPTDVDAAVAAAGRAFPAWRDTALAERINLVNEAAERIVLLPEEVPRLLTKEMGKPLWESELDFGFAEMILRSGCEIVTDALAPEVVAEDEHGRVILEKVPRGVAAAITPWNWPVGLLYIKIAGALLTRATRLSASRRRSLRCLCSGRSRRSTGFSPRAS